MKNSQRAFTVAEVLVVIGVLTLMGVILTETFFRSIRGSSKAQVISNIKQNGQSALETMDKTIRNSEIVVCVSSTGSTLTLLQGGIYTRYRFNPPTGGSNPANGFISVDSLTDCTSPLVANSYQTLTDTDSRAGVSVTAATFSRSKLAGFKDKVEVEFEVAEPVGTPTALGSQIDPVRFKTSVGLR